MTPVRFGRGGPLQPRTGEPRKPRARVIRLPESWDAVAFDGVVYRIRRRHGCRFAVRVRHA
jgi:hypothetical protein